MPAYDWSCSSCSFAFEARAPMAVELLPCLKCGLNARRLFSPTSAISIPRHFRSARNWALPPKDSSRWETMVRPGSEKKTVKEQSLREYLQAEGVRGA